jgi:hypothetical protein
LAKKVYDFSAPRVKRRIVTALKQRRNESTKSDLVAATGLPAYQVDQVLNDVVNEYAGHLRVTESGEILYHFPHGMRSRLRGPGVALRKALGRALRVTGKVLGFLFRIWIVAMLIGYFVLFVALLVLAMVASVAGSAAKGEGRSRSRMGGFGTFYLTTRVVDLFIRIWIYSGMRRKRGEPTQPLHQSVFAFVFGDQDPTKNWDEHERREVIEYIRGNKGVMIAEELAALTGRSYDDVQLLLNEYLVEYEGEPRVTEAGTLLYAFPELLRTKELTVLHAGVRADRKPTVPFNTNKRSMNRWIAFFNGFNLVFGSYFLYYSSIAGSISPNDGFARLFIIVANFIAQAGNPLPFLYYGLGLVPVVFSALFYAVPAVRHWMNQRRNRGIREENLRKTVYEAVLSRPESVDPGTIRPRDADEEPPRWESVRDHTIKRLGAEKSVEVAEAPSGGYVYRFPELARELHDMKSYRERIDVEEYRPGDTVFDSNE